MSMKHRTILVLVIMICLSMVGVMGGIAHIDRTTRTDAEAALTTFASYIKGAEAEITSLSLEREDAIARAEIAEDALEDMTGVANIEKNLHEMWERNHGYVLGQRNEARDERDAETERADRNEARAEAYLRIAVEALSRARDAERLLDEATFVQQISISPGTLMSNIPNADGQGYWSGGEAITVPVLFEYNEWFAIEHRSSIRWVWSGDVDLVTS